MYSVIIRKIEYRSVTEQNFTVLDIIPHSGMLDEDNPRTSQGLITKSTVQGDIANVTAATDLLMKQLRRLKLALKLTDTNGLVHLVGDENYCARMTFRKIIPQAPGSFNGYHCTFVCNSPAGSSVS